MPQQKDDSGAAEAGRPVTTKWFQVGGYSEPQLIDVDVIRETAQMLVTHKVHWNNKSSERRRSKEGWFRTELEAWEAYRDNRMAVLDRTREKVTRTRQQLDRAIEECKKWQ